MPRNHATGSVKHPHSFPLFQSHADEGGPENLHVDGLSHEPNMGVFVLISTHEQNPRLGLNSQNLMREFDTALSRQPNVEQIHIGVLRSCSLHRRMSGRGFEEKAKQNPKEFGLITRHRSHASGRLSGDQFCVYVANRLVIPNLRPDDLSRFATGEVNLDRLTKSYVHESLDYQYCTVSGSAEAYALEERCRRGVVFGQKPLLNTAD